MTATECSRFEQRSGIKFLVANKCNHVKFTEECVICMFESKNVSDWAKHGFSPTSLSGNTLTLVKKKFRMLWSVMKVILTVFWDIKGPIT